MKTLAQEYLQTHTLADLYKNHGVRASVYDHLISLNYHQMNAKASDPLACQCRGIVLKHNKRLSSDDSNPLNNDIIVGETEIYAWPFTRFFNYHESASNQHMFDWETASVQEKLDGTLCIVYYDFTRECWNVGTRNTPFAQFPTNVYDKEQTVRNLFDTAIHLQTGKDTDTVMDSMDPERQHTWMFELTSPANRIVVKYDSLSVTCLGRRNMQTGMESNPFVLAQEHNLPIPDIYPLNTLQDVITFVQKRPPDKHEGVVLCDANFKRAKVKSSAYIAGNLVQGQLSSSPRHLTETIIAEGWDEVAPSLPGYLQKLGSCMNDAFRDIVKRHIEVYSEVIQKSSSFESKVGTPEHRKAFAVRASKYDHIEMSAIMSTYGSQNQNDLIDWFHCRDAQGQAKRASRIKKLTKMIDTEMKRNGTSKKEFWEEG